MFERRNAVSQLLQNGMVKTQRYTEKSVHEKIAQELETGIQQFYPNNSKKDFKEFAVVPNWFPHDVELVQTHPTYLIQVSKYLTLDPHPLKAKFNEI